MKNILIVEDDRDVAKALVIQLRAAGFRSAIASDGLNAISMARSQDPDLVILDISLPAGDGFSVVERLDNMAATMGIPIVFVTGRNEPELRERAESAGAVGFFPKPYEFDDLLGCIHEALGTAPASPAAVPSGAVPSGAGPVPNRG